MMPNPDKPLESPDDSPSADSKFDASDAAEWLEITPPDEDTDEQG
jgi:hypothetical protein